MQGGGGGTEERSATDLVITVGSEQPRMGGATLRSRLEDSPRATIGQELGSQTYGRGGVGGGNEVTGRAIAGGWERKEGGVECNRGQGESKARSLDA